MASFSAYGKILVGMADLIGLLLMLVSIMKEWFGKGTGRNVFVFFEIGGGGGFRKLA
jgi:hypothetical protein